jgi:hypothetical protein
MKTKSLSQRVTRLSPLLLLSGSSAFADDTGVTRGYFELMMVDLSRNHPLGVFLTVLAVLLVIAAIGYIAVRRIRREAHDLMEQGQKRYRGLESRLGTFYRRTPRNPENPDVPATPENPERKIS